MLLPVFLVLPCHPGRGDALRWAPFLSDKKWGKESLRAFLPKDPLLIRGWNCVKAMVGPWPGGVTWMIGSFYGWCPIFCGMVLLLPGP